MCKHGTLHLDYDKPGSYTEQSPADTSTPGAESQPDAESQPGAESQPSKEKESPALAASSK